MVGKCPRQGEQHLQRLCHGVRLAVLKRSEAREAGAGRGRASAIGNEEGRRAPARALGTLGKAL